MTSVVDTSVKHFMSTMVGAPVLSGTAGAMIAVLDACLVNGFDIKVATSLVVASGVATLSFAGSHSATVDSVVLVEGVTGPLTALNGEQKVTAIGAGVVKFATAAADGTAAGTISFKMAPAGWEKSFSGTNLAVYKSLDPQSTGMYLRVDDTGTTSCRICGYETMSDVSTGTGPFPTDAQVSGGGYWSKSAGATATAVLWALFSDGRKVIAYVAPYYGINASKHGYTRGFGDDIPKKPGGDPYAFSLNYSISASTASQYDACLDINSTQQNAMPRGHSGLGACALHKCYSYVGTYSNGHSGKELEMGVFPGEIDGGLLLSQKFFSVTDNNPVRSDLPGLYSVAQNNAFSSFASFDKILGTGRLAGHKLMALNPTYAVASDPTTTNTGVSFVDITGPWR